MMRTPVSVAPIESVATIDAKPRSVVAIGRGNDHANYWRWSIEDRSRRWRRRVIVSRRGSAVRLNHLGAGVRAQSRCKPEYEYRQCYYNKFLSHDRISLLLLGRLNPRITAKLPKESVPRLRSPLAVASKLGASLGQTELGRGQRQRQRQPTSPRSRQRKSRPAMTS